MSAERRTVWERIASQPVFVLTSDQDWAPEWAVRRFLERLEPLGLPLHVFRTNPSPFYDGALAAGRIGQGWHPNFLPGSSHGSTIEEVLAYCKRHFPGARTVRTHCFAEDTFRWQALAAAGMIADSQFAALFQARLMPLVHFTGIVRLPVYFNDDVFSHLAGLSLSLDPIRATLFTPGLKILNFHPVWVACNMPGRDHYDHHRSRIFGSVAPAPGVIHEGRGTATVFEEILKEILSAGHPFERFEDLAIECSQFVRRTPEFSPAPAWLGRAGAV